MSALYWAMPLARRIHLSDAICIVTLRAAQEGRPALIRRATRLVSLQIIQASVNASLPSAPPN